MTTAYCAQSDSCISLSDCSRRRLSFAWQWRFLERKMTRDTEERNYFKDRNYWNDLIYYGWRDSTINTERNRAGNHLPKSREKLKMTPEMKLNNDVGDSIQSLARVEFGRGGNKVSSVVNQWNSCEEVQEKGRQEKESRRSWRMGIGRQCHRRDPWKKHVWTFLEYQRSDERVDFTSKRQRLWGEVKERKQHQN